MPHEAGARAREAVREAVRARVAGPPPPEVAEIAAALAAWSAGTLHAAIFFGSRRTQARPDPHSAYDFFLATGADGPFYRALSAAGALRRRPGRYALLGAFLPPNVISLRVPLPGEAPRHAKCAVLTLARLRRETSSRRKDHFCAGRLFQPTALVFARDEASRAAALDALVEAHVVTYTWARPSLPAQFDAEGYCRTLLRASLGREIRPEPSGRADALFEAQRGYMEPVYAALLGALAEEGELRALGGGRYALARPAGAAERLRTELFFRWSLVRATARWAKYVLTFDDWLEYLVRKARRHTGEEIVLSERERRLPLVFLWPRVIRYLREKDGRG